MSREHPALPHQASPAGLPVKDSSHSFWHTQPSPLLIGHRSTRNLPETADVVVIGSGMTGASVAHHLLTKNENVDSPAGGLNVVMLEAREACWGATGRNGGHCQPLLFETPHDASVGHFELKNFRTLQKLIKEKEIDCEFVEQPGVRAIYSQHHLDEAQEALGIMEQSAPDLRKMMKLVTDKKELAKYRIPTATGAVVTSIAARMWPYKFVSRILEDLLTSTDLHGTFNLQTLTPALSITPHTNNHWTVSTERGSITTDKVVLATNAYTSHLLPNFADLIVPCRGQMSALHPLPSVHDSNRLQTSFGFLGDGMDDYLVQRPTDRGGHLMFGGGRQHGESIGVTDDSVVDAQTAQYLRSRLVSAFDLPEGRVDEKLEFKAANEWSGIMGYSRDEQPWVGPVPDHDGVFVAAGYTGHGMPNTWLCGKAIAVMVLLCEDNTCSEDLVAKAGGIVGLPVVYEIGKERIERALKGEGVKEKDWAEMRREG
ncbi:hypothetical protein LTR62_008775 [Meristemomyces frigidus]|uniref:FAD dependent oxidoreductase domain-containing protein n=1 Tax=Meristemomyces frigidus TaxID=1508187 RepID=A0AAN7YCI5_9PEZI|nr:hypothetical protein LTR62_008775 [Meristemomyces frigidus]